MDNWVSVFDRWAQNYDVTIHEEVPCYQEMLRALVRRIPRGVAGEVIDLGSGTGNLTHLLTELLPDTEVVAVDYSAEMHQKMRAKLGRFSRPPRIVQLSIEDICFEPASLSGVVSNLTLHHFDHQTKRELFGRIYAWLKVGGFFYVGDYVDAPTAEFQKMAIIDALLLRGDASPEKASEYEKMVDEQVADEMDKPSSVLDQAVWLREVGFQNVDIVWKRGPHAVFGGEKF